MVTGDHGLAARDHGLFVGNNKSAAKIGKKTDVNDGLNARAGNQVDARPDNKPDVGLGNRPDSRPSN